MPADKKIRVTISPRIIELIEKEAAFYEMTRNRLCNLIFEGHRTDEYCQHSSCSKKKVIQFNLSVENIKHYESIMNANGVTNESEFFRGLFEGYERLSYAARQIEIFKKLYNELEMAVEKRKIIKIEYGEEVIEIEPYFITSDVRESDNYLFGYSLSNCEYAVFKLRKIKGVMFTGKNFAARNEEYVKSVAKNFDPYLSHGHVVKLRLVGLGLETLENFDLIMPKLLERDGDVLKFECSQRYAEIFFSPFMDRIEIIEPESLRDRFREKLTAAAGLY